MSNRSSLEIQKEQAVPEPEADHVSPVEETDNDSDEFGNDFVDAQDDDDDFGDFDDFEGTTELEPPEEPAEPVEPVEPTGPTEATVYTDILSSHSPEKLNEYFTDYLNRLWDTDIKLGITETCEKETDILNTSCSRDLWSKLASDAVFYNPITGAVGQFQWTRSETNKSYLAALGVTIKHEKPLPPLSPRRAKKRETIAALDVPTSPVSSPSLKRSVSVSSGLKVVTPKMDETSKEAKREAEQELELDIDIARAYCELTEDTIRVFPNVKLNAMVTELTRLQKQAGEYLDQLLDQKEQLKIDAETYNDLISCIVGHAQRLHEHSKDASPAMVSKKKSSSFNFGKRKPSTTTQQSVSMGGGVVGVKKNNNTDTK